MNRKRMMFFAYASAFIILVVLAILLYRFSGNTAPVTLATPVPSYTKVSPSPGDSTGNNKTLDIGTDTVQAVISTMKRQESYALNTTVTAYWSGGKAEYKISAYVRSGTYRLSVSGPKNDPAKNIIITDSNFYVWYGNSKSYYTGNAGSKNDPALMDQFEMIPTYEDVLKLKQSEIKEAGFGQYNNEPCIYVRAQSGTFNYIYNYYISVNTGLLVAASTYNNDTLVYSMNADSLTLSVPSDDMFRLPDGKSVINS